VAGKDKVFIRFMREEERKGEEHSISKKKVEQENGGA